MLTVKQTGVVFRLQVLLALRGALCLKSVMQKIELNEQATLHTEKRIAFFESDQVQVEVVGVVPTVLTCQMVYDPLL